MGDARAHSAFKAGRDHVIAQALGGVVPPDVLTRRSRHPDEAGPVGERDIEGAIVSLASTLPTGVRVWTRTHADGQLSDLTGDLRRSKRLREGTRFLLLRGPLPARCRLRCGVSYLEWMLHSLRHRLQRPFQRRGVGSEPP